jgi:hypothetical protein
VERSRINEEGVKVWWVKRDERDKIHEKDEKDKKDGRDR